MYEYFILNSLFDPNRYKIVTVPYGVDPMYHNSDWELVSGPYDKFKDASDAFENIK